METIKLTKPYIVEGILFREGVELEITGDEDIKVNEPSTEPTNEVDFGIAPKNVKKEEKPETLEEDEETVTEDDNEQDDENNVTEENDEEK